VASSEAATALQRLVISVRSVFICGERVNARTVFKWAIGVLAFVVLIGVGAGVWLIVVGIMSLEKGEQHRRQFQAELDSGRWDFGEQPALFAVVQGIVKNDSEAIRGGKERAGFASVRKRRHDASQLRGQTIVAATRIRRGG
jgi:hypothetical protein